MAYWKKNPVYHGDDTSGFVDPNWCCSSCGGQAPTNPYWGVYDFVDTCPHCGEKMEYEEASDGNNSRMEEVECFEYEAYH